MLKKIEEFANAMVVLCVILALGHSWSKKTTNGPGMVVLFITWMFYRILVLAITESKQKKPKS